jgi:hypothetical protein
MGVTGRWVTLLNMAKKAQTWYRRDQNCTDSHTKTFQTVSHQARTLKLAQWPGAQ